VNAICIESEAEPLFDADHPKAGSLFHAVFHRGGTRVLGEFGRE
jgi:hypothetical protein